MFFAHVREKLMNQTTDVRARGVNSSYQLITLSENLVNDVTSDEHLNGVNEQQPISTCGIT